MEVVNELILVNLDGQYSIYSGSLVGKFDLSDQAAPGWRPLYAMSPDEGVNQQNSLESLFLEPRLPV